MLLIIILVVKKEIIIIIIIIIVALETEEVAFETASWLNGRSGQREARLNERDAETGKRENGRNERNKHAKQPTSAAQCRVRAVSACAGPSVAWLDSEIPVAGF